MSICNRFISYCTVTDEYEFHHVLLFVRDRRVIISQTHRLHPHTPRNSEDSLRSDPFQGRQQSCIRMIIWSARHSGLSRRALISVYLGREEPIPATRWGNEQMHGPCATEWSRDSLSATSLGRRRRPSVVSDDSRADEAPGMLASQAHRHLSSHLVSSAFHIVERRNFSDSIV